jgi:hypothetical protein
VAAEFGGYAAVDAMTWQDYSLARQYLVEARIGTRKREAKAREDALARQAVEAVQKQERKRGPRRDG